MPLSRAIVVGLFLAFAGTAQAKTVTVKFECKGRKGEACVEARLCPADTRVTHVRAFCNLENDDVRAADLSGVPWGKMEAQNKTSRPDGICRVHKSRIGKGLGAIANLTSSHHARFAFGCRGDDGRDCVIKGEAKCQTYYQPVLLMTPKVPHGKVVQGLARLDDDHFLYTQDVKKDSRFGNTALILTIVDNRGKRVKVFNHAYQSHAQSIYVRRNGADYDLFVASANMRGLAQFRLRKSGGKFTSLTLIKEIFPTDNGRGLSGINSFSAHPGTNRIAILHPVADAKGRKRRTVSVYKLDEFLRAGNLRALHTISMHEHQNFDGDTAPGQGLALGSAYVYVLTGGPQAYQTDRRETHKLLYQYALATGRVSKTHRITAGLSYAKAEAKNRWYEPEGLFIEKDHLYFTMNTGPSGGHVVRTYRMSNRF